MTHTKWTSCLRHLRGGSASPTNHGPALFAGPDASRFDACTSLAKPRASISDGHTRAAADRDACSAGGGDSYRPTHWHQRGAPVRMSRIKAFGDFDREMLA